MNVLINVPRLDMPGGVVNYYQVLRSCLDSGKRYFETGGKADESGSLTLVRRVIADYWEFHRTLSTKRYSLVHLNPSFGSKSMPRDAFFLLIARAHSVPVLVFFHGWDSEYQAYIARRFSPLFRYVFNKAARIVVLAEDFQRQLQAMGVRTPISTLSTCIDDSLFELSLPVKKPESHSNILYLSRLDHGKGVVEAIKAYDALRRKFPQVTLSIAGDGPVRSAAERIVRKQRIVGVSFLGHVEGTAKSQAFLESDIFFFPTFYGEGMPIVVLEAMAFGLPVITRSVGGLKDFFENERMGFITDKSDPNEFASLLDRLISDPAFCHRVGDYNRKFAEKHFAASAVGKKLQGIYEQILDCSKL